MARVARRLGIVILLLALPGSVLHAQARQPDGGPYPYPIRPHEAVCLPKSAKIEFRSGDPEVYFQRGHRRPDSIPGLRVVDVDTLTRPVVRKGPSRDWYPAALRKERPQGFAVLEYVITSTGRADPCRIRAIDGSHLEFVDAAVHAVTDMEFEPGRYRGRPVAVIVRQRFSFGRDPSTTSRVRGQ